MRDYLAQFARRAAAAGLAPKSPGNNWVALRDLVPGSHISLTVRKDQVQVNLNNEGDLDRQRYDRLFADRAELSGAFGEPLQWEKKEARKKTAVRVTYPSGLDDRESWDAQQEWAIRIMQAFEREFGARLKSPLPSADRMA
jgi:hypothetical protein